MRWRTGYILYYSISAVIALGLSAWGGQIWLAPAFFLLFVGGVTLSHYISCGELFPDFSHRRR